MHAKPATWILKSEEDFTYDVYFGSLILVDGFYQLGWTVFSSLFCFDVRVRARDFGVSKVVVDDVVELEEGVVSGS